MSSTNPTDDTEKNSSDTTSGAESATEDAERSTLEALSEVEITRRTALAGISSAAGIGSLGTAGTTDVSVTGNAANGPVSPGANDVNVLNLNLDSEDTVIDVSGGSGLDDSRDYEAVTATHPTPSTGQELRPGDLVSEFSIRDRVFTSTYLDFDLDNDHLYQSAGYTKANIDWEVAGVTFSQTRYVTPYAEEFVPFGYIASDGPAEDCVATNVLATNAGGGQPARWTFTGYSNDPRDVRTIRVRTTDNPAAAVGAGNVTVSFVPGGAPGVAAASNDEGILTITLSSTFSFENLDLGDQVRVIVNGIQVATGEAKEIEFLDGSGNIITSGLVGSTPSSRRYAGTNVASPFTGEISSSIAEVVNPQLSVKVDSVGVGQPTVSTSNLSPPITANQLQNQVGTPLGIGASSEAILVDSSGNVPERAQGNGYTIDWNGNTITVEFREHRTDVTLANSGYFSGVEGCTVPRGDAAPCTQFECTGEQYGRERATSGVRDISQVGLADGFSSLNNTATDRFVRVVGVDVPDRDAPTRAAPFEDPLLLGDKFDRDEANLNGNTGVLDAVSVFDIVDEADAADTELRRLSVNSQASEVVSPINPLFNNGRTNQRTNVNSTSNGFLQIPVDPGFEPNFLLEKGDSLQRFDTSNANRTNLLARGSVDNRDAIANLAAGSSTAVATESEAYRELDLDPSSDIEVTLPTDPRTGNTAAAATQSSGSQFETTVQILVAGQYTCPTGTPLNAQNNDEYVDISRDDRVTYEVQSGAASTVTDDGVFIPASSDQNQIITVDVFYDGCPAGSVNVTVINAGNISNTNNNPAFADRTTSTANAYSERLFDPLPSGEEFPAPVVVDVDVTTPAGTRQEAIDLSQMVGANGNQKTQYGVSNPSTAAATVTNDGVVTAGTPGATNATRPTNDATVEFSADFSNTPGGLAPASNTANKTFDVLARYLFRAAARPGNQGFISTNSEDIILAEVADNTGDTARTDDVLLDSGTKIADELERSIGQAIRNTNPPSNPDLDDPTREDVGVAAVFDPGNHSASGYVVRSTTEVGSAFDQSVDVSSVEVGLFEEVLGPNEVIDPNNLDLDPNQSNPAASDYLERQEIAPALGLADGANGFNEVNAETVDSSNAPGGRPTIPDRYNPRADPLDLVDPTRTRSCGNEFLGDNQLTCNSLAFGESLSLIGSEPPTGGIHGDNSRVLTYYDSQINEVTRALGGGGVGTVQLNKSTSGGAPDTLFETAPTNRPGAPNVSEGDLPSFVHNADEIYTLWEVLAPNFAPNGALPRARFKQYLGGPPGNVAAVPVFPLFRDTSGAPLNIGLIYGFVEGFDVLEVGDSVADPSAAGSRVPSTLERDINDGKDRGLGPRETFVQNFYGDRFDGMSIRNEGSIDIGDDVLEHRLEVTDPAGPLMQAGQSIDIAGNSRAPLFPQSKPDVAVFIGARELDSNTVLDTIEQDVGGITYSPDPDPSNPKDEYTTFVFDDDQDRELYFGTDVTTPCGTDVDDTAVMSIELNIDNAAPPGETLQYEVPPLYDNDKDGSASGEYTAVRPGQSASKTSATYQDRGIFFEGHDDQGNENPDLIGPLLKIEGEDTSTPTATPTPTDTPTPTPTNGGGGGSSFPCSDYDCNGSGNVTTQGLVSAISDWRNNNITTQQLIDVISSWRNR